MDRFLYFNETRHRRSWYEVYMYAYEKVDTIFIKPLELHTGSV